MAFCVPRCKRCWHSDKSPCPRRCLTRPLRAPPSCTTVGTSSLPGASASSNPALTPIRGNVIFQRDELQGLIMQSWRCRDLSANPPRRCGYSRPVSYVRPTDSGWRCRPSHGGNIWAFLPHRPGNSGNKTSSLTSAGSPGDAFGTSRRRRRRSSSWVVVQQGLFGGGTAAPALAGGRASRPRVSAGTRLNKPLLISGTPSEFRQRLEDFFSLFLPQFCFASVSLCSGSFRSGSLLPKAFGDPGGQWDAGGQETSRKGPWVKQVPSSARRRV